jgi:hypothetical protein
MQPEDRSQQERPAIPTDAELVIRPRNDFEEHFSRLHCAILDMRNGDPQARGTFRNELRHIYENEAETEIALERISVIAKELPLATNVNEAKGLLYIAYDLGPNVPSYHRALFEKAVEHGLAAKAHSVVRSAYLELANCSIDHAHWTEVARYAALALDLPVTAEEGEHHFTSYLTAYALQAFSLSSQARDNEAVTIAKKLIEVFTEHHDYFEKILKYGLPHEQAFAYAATDALYQASEIFWQEAEVEPIVELFDKLLELVDGSTTTNTHLRCKSLYKYAKALREVAPYLYEDEEDFTFDATLELGVKQANAGIEIIEKRGSSWDDQKLRGNLHNIKADLLLELGRFESCLTECASALAAYDRSEAYGVACREDKGDLESIRHEAERKLGVLFDYDSITDDDDVIDPDIDDEDVDPDNEE